MWLNTNLGFSKGRGYVIHLNTWREVVTLGRSSASKNDCKHIHWHTGHSQLYLTKMFSLTKGKESDKRMKIKKWYLENQWQDYTLTTELKSSKNNLHQWKKLKCNLFKLIKTYRRRNKKHLLKANCLASVTEQSRSWHFYSAQKTPIGKWFMRNSTLYFPFSGTCRK